MRASTAPVLLTRAWRRSAASLFALLCLSGCATTPTGRVLPLDLLDRGHVSKSEVLNSFGDPDAEYEHGRVLAYRLQAAKNRYSRVPDAAKRIGWEDIDYDLVLVFDGSDVLERHSLVPIRAR